VRLVCAAYSRKSLSLSRSAKSQTDLIIKGIGRGLPDLDTSKNSGRIGDERIHCVMSRWRADMAERMPGFFDVEERLRELTAKGDDLERVKALLISRYSGPR
jgi:hypothetical protein